MISDTLHDSPVEIERYQRDFPQSYDDLAEDIRRVKKHMRALMTQLDRPPDVDEEAIPVTGERVVTTNTITRGDLDQFRGTSTYHRHPLVHDLAWTDGISFLVENADALWLINLIASYQLVPEVRREPLQVWTLEFKSEDGAVVYVQRDKDESHILDHELTFTDFPESLGPKFVLCVEDSSLDGLNAVKVMFLPSER